MASKLTAKETALIFRETFHDQYEDEDDFREERIEAMTEEQAREFVKDHIETMIAINGISELWTVERKAIKDLCLKIK